MLVKVFHKTKSKPEFTGPWKTVIGAQIPTLCLKKFAPLNSLQLCQILTDFQNFCPRSAHARDERHNAVAKLLTQKLVASGHTVEAEPTIKTDHGVRRPDVVAYKPGESGYRRRDDRCGSPGRAFGRSWTENPQVRRPRNSCLGFPCLLYTSPSPRD